MVGIGAFIESLLPNYVATFLPSNDVVGGLIVTWFFLVFFAGRWWTRHFRTRWRYVIFPTALVAISLVGLLVGSVLLAKRLPTLVAAEQYSDGKTTPFVVHQNIYCESRSIYAGSRDSPLYENTFYLMVGSASRDGKTLRRVQARVQGYETPVLAPIKDTLSDAIDIRHGETAFFMIGRIVSSKSMGIFKGRTDVKEDELRIYEHNAALGSVSLEIWSKENKRQYALGYVPETSAKFILFVVVSADDAISTPLTLNVDLGSQLKPIAFDGADQSKT